MSAIHVSEFDPSRLLFSDPKIVEGETGKFVKCDIKYMYADGTPNNLLVILPTNFCFGVSPVYAYGKERKEEFVTGKYQVAYSVTSQETKDSPTPEEQAIFKLNEGFKARLKQYVIDNAEELGSGFEEVIENDRLLSLKVKDLIKPATMQDPKHPKNKLKKITDPSKTWKWYLKIWHSFKNGGKMLTSMHGPGDIPVNPLKYLNVWGNITPVVAISWVYFDGDKGASAQCYISEANFVPSSAARRRLLQPNEAPQEEDGEVENIKRPTPAELLETEEPVVPLQTSDPNKDLAEEEKVVKPKMRKPKKKKQIVEADEDE